MIKSEKKRKPRNGPKSPSSVPAFLLKTYEILEDPEYSDIISWNKEGTAFIVKKINDFAEKILPKYFKHSNFASFVRQLNMYDFHKARHDNNENEFKHRSFKRGAKHLLGDIKRKTAENPPSPSPNQLVPVNKEFDFEKFKKDCSLFTSELGTIKTRQGEQEKVMKLLFTQNNSLMRENKLLWNELHKGKEKYEKKIGKLMYFIYSLMQHNGNAPISSFNYKKGIEADLADALDLSDDQNMNRKSPEETALSLRTEKMSKDQERSLKKAIRMFQSKDDPNINALIDELQDPGKPINSFSGNIDDLDDFVNEQVIESKSKKKARSKKMAANLDDDDEYEVVPKKLVKGDMIDQNDLKANQNAIIEDLPPHFQRQYSDSDYKPYINYNGSIPLSNAELESPKPYGNYNNSYPEFYPRDLSFEKKDSSYDLPFINPNAFISPQPLSPEFDKL